MYKKARNLVVTSIRDSKKRFFDSKIDRNTSKSLFQAFNEFCTASNSRTIDIDVENFNSFFTSIGKSLDTFENTLPNLEHCYREKSFYLAPVSELEIFQLLQNLPNKKSCGTDEICSSILKAASSVLKAPLSKTLNNCINQGVFPKCLKIAKVIPIHKNGVKTDPNNYRPISLLNCLSKVFERALYNRMLDFISQEKILSPSQFGFRKNRNCTHALTCLTEFMRQTIEKKKYGNVIFLDLKKAFDTVNHTILGRKLFEIGFRGLPHKLLTNYLDQRFQQVYNNGAFSTSLEISYGVPQGSILGPLLFLLFINDLPPHIQASNLALFADDTTIYQDSFSLISENLSTEVEDWFKDNHLTVSHSKCVSMSFGKKSTSVINNECTFENVSSHKYLGIIIDKQLKFQEHCKMVVKKLNQFCGVTYRARYFFSRRQLLRFYTAFINSRILYGILIYGNTTKNFLSEILKAQKRIIRAIFFKRPSESTNNIFEEHKIPTVFDLIIKELVNYVFLQIRRATPVTSLVFMEHSERRVTRSSTKGLLPLQTASSQTKRNSLSNKTTKAFNFLTQNELIPKNLTELTESSYKRFFKRFYNNFLFRNQVLYDLLL